MKNIRKIKINPFTYLIVLLMLFSGYKTILMKILLIFTVHEIGHFFFCRIFNIKINKITIYPFGGLITLDSKINKPIYKDFFIAIGGILFQVLLEIINMLFIKSNDISYYNILILQLNILPIIPMDGSKILFSIFNRFISYYKSLIIYEITSLIFLIFLVVYTLFNSTINIALISYLLVGIISDIKLISYRMKSFFLERHINNLSFKRKKYFKKNNIYLLKREEQGFFLINTWKNEKYLLSKKFDISTYFW